MGMGMVAGAALSLATMIYLKGQGYGLVSDTPPATESRVEGIREDLDAVREDIDALRKASDNHKMRLDFLAQTIVEAGIDKPLPPYEEYVKQEKNPTGIVEAE